MPDAYRKGEPHVPVQSLTGHFLGMQPADLAIVVHAERAPSRVWYRGDDFVALKSDRDALQVRVAELEQQVRRKPPKRMS